MKNFFKRFFPNQQENEPQSLKIRRKGRLQKMSERAEQVLKVEDFNPGDRVEQQLAAMALWLNILTPICNRVTRFSLSLIPCRCRSMLNLII